MMMKMTTEEAHGFWFSADGTRQQDRVGFIVNKIRIRISMKPENITIIQICAPTSRFDDELVNVVDEVNEQLENTVKEIPRKYLLIIQSYWNTKVGHDICEQWT